MKRITFSFNALAVVVGLFAVLGMIGWTSLVAVAVVIIDGAVAAWLLLAPAGVGILLVYKLAGPLDRLRLVLFGGGIGYSLLALAVLAAGLAGLMSKPFWLAVLTVCWVVTLVVAYWLLKRPIKQAVHAQTGSSVSSFSALLVLPFLAIALLGATIPPGVLWSGEGGGYDVLEYHLQAPKEWFQAGRIEYLPHNVYASLPFNAEMTYLLAMIIYGGPYEAVYCAQMLHCLTMVMFVLTVYAICRQWSSAAGLAGLLAAGTCGWLAYLAPLAYNEGPMLWLSAVAIGAVLTQKADQANNQLSVRGALLSGLAVGLASGFKYTAATMIGLPVAIVLAGRCLAWKTPLVARGALKNLAVFLLGCVAAICPWLIRNYSWTGNPVFPFAYEWFGGRDWNEQLAVRWHAGHSPAPEQRSGPARLAALYRQGLTNPLFTRVEAVLAERLGYTDHARRILNRPPILQRPNYGPALVILPVLLFLLARTEKTDRQLLVVLLVQVGFWLGFTHLQDRFLVLCIIPTAMLTGRLATVLFAGSATSPSPPSARPAGASARVAYLAVFATAIFINFGQLYSLYYRHTHTPAGKPVPWFGQTSAFLTGSLGGWQHLAVINRQLPQDAKILLIGEARAFYFDRPVVYWTVFNRNDFALAAAEGVKATVDYLLSMGVTHLYVDWMEVQRLQSTYGLEKSINPAFLKALNRRARRIRLERIYQEGIAPHQQLYRLERLFPPTRPADSPKMVFRCGCSGIVAVERGGVLHLMSGQLTGQSDGRLHGPAIGPVLAGNVEGRSVVRAGADDGQAQRDVDRGVEGQKLYRDQRLVVVHRHDPVVAIVSHRL